VILIDGSLYLIRWKRVANSPETIALYCSNAAKCDPDEKPQDYWTFFGDGLDELKVDDWEVLTRLDVVPIASDHPSAKTWRDDG
jgi:hypothetical protein